MLHTIDRNFYNDAPRLITTQFEALHNELLVVQLEYQDTEGDDVSFSIASHPQHGKTHFTIWTTYFPTNIFLKMYKKQVAVY